MSLLDKGAKRKLILVSAPAGFGKTTLIASWLNNFDGTQSDSPRSAWVSFGEEDNDSERFLSHLIASFMAVDPEIERGIRPLLRTPFKPKLNHILAFLINKLAENEYRNILALDDFHLLNNSEIENAIAFFLDRLPANCCVVILTREEPKLPLHRLRARGELMEIGLQELSFAGEEVEAFLNQTMALGLSADEVRMLEARSEGWIVGLQLAALSLRGRGNVSASGMIASQVNDFSGRHRYIFDYLAAEVLQQQSEEMIIFLRRTAILDRLCAPLCDAVTERRDSLALLAQLERANLFILSLDHDRKWYRYHHLFADFLRTQLSEAEQVVLHLRASKWYQKQGLTSDAIKHALVAREPMEAVRLIRDKAEETLRRGDFATLRTWINALPDEVVRTNSDMSVRKGWILCSQGELARAETYAALATETQRADDPLPQRGMLLSFHSYLALKRGDMPLAMQYAQEAIDLLVSAESFHLSTGFSHLGQAQRLMGDNNAAIRTLRRAIEVSQRMGNHLITVEALYYLSTTLNQQGHLTEAVSACERLRSCGMDEHGDPLPVFGVVSISLGLLYYETNDLARSRQALEEGLTHCLHMGLINRTLRGQCVLAKLYFAHQEFDAMWRTLGDARKMATKLRSQRFVDTETAELQLRLGQTSAAAITLASLPQNPSERSEQENLVYCRLLMEEQNYAAAQGILTDLERRAQKMDSRRSLIAIHALQSLAHYFSHQSKEALYYLERAIRLAAPEGYCRIFIDVGLALAPLLHELKPKSPAFVCSLLDIFLKDPSGLNPMDNKIEPKLFAHWRPDSSTALTEPLTKTQLTILWLVSEGLSNRDIAARLKITEGTTKWHLNRIFGKLNVGSRTQAVAYARRIKLLNILLAGISIFWGANG